MPVAQIQLSSPQRLRRLAKACFGIGALLGAGAFLHFPDPVHLSLGLIGAAITFVLGRELLHQLDQAFLEQTQALRSQSRSEAVLQARVRLMAEAPRTSLHDFLVLTLDEVERFTDSKVSFYHFVDPDQENIHLQAWSTQTAKVYCHATGAGQHYGLSKAGVWADCVRQRKAVMHNDYASLPGKKGLPAGHAALIRELVVPIFREDKIVAILGVGNKESFYDDDDVGMVSLFADIAWGLAERKMAELELETYRKRLEDMVQERELRYSVLFDSGNDAIFVTEIDSEFPGAFVEVNAVACTSLGYSRAELLALSPNDICPWDDLAQFQEIKERLLEDQRCIYEATLVAKSGESIPVEVSARLLQWQGRRWTLSIARNIADRKRSEAELKQAITRAESASRVKSEFLANMSHEIRTPLNAVIGFSELLAGMETTPDQMNYIESIRSSGRGLLRLINDILDMSKMEAGRMRIAATPTDLRHLLDELVRMFGAQVQEKRIALESRIEEGLPAAVLVDEIRLRQIMLNLVGNAIKFTSQGKVSLHARARPSPTDADRVDLEFQVTDTGVGIAREEQEMIFDAFEQSHGTDSRRFGGTGLGLAISRKLAGLMGGEIRLESHPGAGSTFSVLLPGLPVVDSGSATLQKPEDFNSVRFTGGRVLVVDDVECNRMLMREILAQVGLEAMEAENGEVALLLANESRPELILMDLRMPVLDGMEATRRLRGNTATADIPVVALTASVDRTNSPELMAAKFDGFLGKPIELPSLVKTLDRWFSRAAIQPATAADPLPDPSPGDAAIEASTALVASFRTRSAFGLNFGSVQILSQDLSETARVRNLPDLAALAARLAEAGRSFDVRAIERILQKLERTA
ncbi:MAG: GAF domain-containing protein [Fibrobacterota bacterium]|nr:GAF domain-containing protein [Fibrobacterota bacterium]QQS05354.1 MAG: GAF domain-containing protein [Fibrobacterota bacterium]